ncbi:hypothetical protein SLEP1_g60174 [Rubroshorea leprosula]|uniref:Uncharacterized protein n=1 Tax=Rubroshorea leprosula TaxID=152421 RepID=A0AAV5MZ58_9ROSI|nr:hypothetical protein SLEP1_g60174 [Rubroshorea leprosula]
MASRYCTTCSVKSSSQSKLSILWSSIWDVDSARIHSISTGRAADCARTGTTTTILGSGPKKD